MTDETRIRLGAQGWNYQAWVGPFYPPGTRAVDYLTLYARAFDTVEIDATFYAVPSASTVRGWASRVPDSFTFSLKLPQEITHRARLKGAQGSLEEFLESARVLGDKLGPILIQLGPDFGPIELPALVNFLPLLPRDLRFAVEFRHAGWINERVHSLLASHNVALALTDARWISRGVMLDYATKPTADFAYVRWMGSDRSIVDYSHTQIDRSREIDQWARVLPELARRVRTVYAYANNHFAGHSPATLRDLQRRLGYAVTDPATLGDQMSLF